MSYLCKSLGIAIAAAVLSGCISHGPDGLAYSRGDSTAVGVTGGSGGGTVSGSSVAPEKEKEKRGNTPVGTDRDGHGPAAGAIVDPTGAATRGKPY